MRNKKGFSLVELLIVVAIIGTLSAIAVPAYQNYQKKARRAQATSMLNTCYKTQLLYHSENEVYGTTFFSSGEPIDPNRENFSATGNFYYDLGIEVVGRGFVGGASGRGFINYTNPIQSSGAPGDSNFLSSGIISANPAAGPAGTRFICGARGNLDGDATPDDITVDHNNNVVQRVNDI